jgi:hypothetical protein
LPSSYVYISILLSSSLVCILSFLYFPSLTVFQIHSRPIVIIIISFMWGLDSTNELNCNSSYSSSLQWTFPHSFIQHTVFKPILCVKNYH